MLRWISTNIRIDRIWNEEIHLKLGVAPSNENRSNEKIGLSCLRWFGNVEMRPINALERKSDSIQVKWMKRGKERSKITLVKAVKKIMY